MYRARHLRSIPVDKRVNRLLEELNVDGTAGEAMSVYDVEAEPDLSRASGRSGLAENCRAADYLD